jgi:hypothetical protein
MNIQLQQPLWKPSFFFRKTEKNLTFSALYDLISVRKEYNLYAFFEVNENNFF